MKGKRPVASGRRKARPRSRTARRGANKLLERAAERLLSPTYGQLGQELLLVGTAAALAGEPDSQMLAAASVCTLIDFFLPGSKPDKNVAQGIRGGKWREAFKGSESGRASESK